MVALAAASLVAVVEATVAVVVVVAAKVVGARVVVVAAQERVVERLAVLQDFREVFGPAQRVWEGLPSFQLLGMQ